MAFYFCQLTTPNLKRQIRVPFTTFLWLLQQLWDSQSLKHHGPIFKDPIRTYLSSIRGNEDIRKELYKNKFHIMYWDLTTFL
jgi:hypothetical protein